MGLDNRVGLRSHGAVTVWALMALFLVVGQVHAQADTEAQAVATAEVSDQAAREKAERIITDMSRNEDPFIRANAMEATASAGQIAMPLLHIALEDTHPAVRFAALTAIGKRQERSMQAAIERRVEDENASVRAAALYALSRIDAKPDMSPLAQMLASQSVTQRSNAALLLGLAGDESAVPMLKEMARVPLVRAAPVSESIVNIQIAEAMALLGDHDAMQVVRAGLFSQYDEVRVLCAQILGRLEDHSMNAALRTLVDQNPVELRLAAAKALGSLGETAPIPVLLEGTDSEIATVRSQAALGLSVFRTSDARAAAGTLQMLSR